MAVTRALLVAAAVEVMTWKLSLHYGGHDDNAQDADEYIAHFFAWLSVWNAWLNHVGRAMVQDHLPYFSDYVVAIQKQLALDMGKIMVNMLEEDVKPKPSIEAVVRFNEFLALLRAEFVSAAYKIATVMMAGEVSAVKFERLTHSTITYGYRCECHDKFSLTLVVNGFTSKLLMAMLKIHHGSVEA